MNPIHEQQAQVTEKFPCSKCGKYACYEFKQDDIRYCDACFAETFDETQLFGLAGKINKACLSVHARGGSMSNIAEDAGRLAALILDKRLRDLNIGGYWHTAYKNVGLELDTLREKLRQLGDSSLVREPQVASTQDAAQEIQTPREPQVAQEIQTSREPAPPQVEGPVAWSGAPHLAAVSFIEREDGRLLCVWNKRYGGWLLPGGMVEEGEIVDEGQARALREETFLETLTRKQADARDVSIPDMASRAQGWPTFVVEGGAEGRGSHVFVFRVTVSGTPREVETGCPVTWLTREEFLKWSPFAKHYVDVFKMNPPEAPRDFAKEKSLQLREFAERASIGNWKLIWRRNGDGSWNVARIDEETGKNIAFSSDDMAHIAVANPKTILTLLNRLDELEKENAAGCDPGADDERGHAF